MLDPFFLESVAGRIHCTVIRPGTPGRAGPALLFLPPFAEEMNKSRHVVARLGHRLAREGFITLVPDLHGTGDSDGDFGDATWSAWRGNVIDAARWLLAREGRPLFIGGLRLGATLAVDVMDALPVAPRSVLLWQPVPSGRAALTQFLRLRVAASLSASRERETTDSLRARLAAGEPVEVSGYTLAPAMFEALETLDLSGAAPPADIPVDWLEVSLGAGGEPLPAARRLAEAWQGGGRSATPEPVGGPQFWATQELADAPALVEHSVTRLCERAR